MCLICVDLAKGRLTVDEARQNLLELRRTDALTDEHYAEVIEKISHEYGKNDLKQILEMLTSRVK